MQRVSRSAAGLVALALLTPAVGAAGLAAAAPLAAQQPAVAPGRIAGTVTDTARVPLPGTQLTVVGTRAGAVADETGRFVIGGVAPGTYQLRAQRVGQRPRLIDGVVVRSGEETRVDVTLQRAAVELAGMVISASRRAEKITDAPATITRIETREIENSVGNSFGGALKQVKGLDFVQMGATAVAVNARGFNSAFNNRMLMLEDNRIAVFPENGLPVGGMTSVPKVDLAGVEVLVGPGSALYGPDASNGVITLSTKDPRQYQGTTIEVAGGTRSFYDVQGRQAGMLSSRVAYKVSGEYQAVSDWENHNNYAPITSTSTTPSPEIGADFDNNVLRGEGALVYYAPGSGRLEVSGGASRSNFIGITNVGRNQIVDWKYGHGQVRYTDNHWFAQVYRLESRSGDTYQLNGVAQNTLRYPSLSKDSVRALSAFPDQASLTAAELQNNFSVAALNGLHVTLGAQYRHDDVSSKRHWLVDRKTGEDVTIDQKGVYGQVEAPVVPWLKLVAAGRYDKHDMFDAQFSPKGGVLVTPAENQTFRVTFNRAYKSPTVLQTSFFFPDFQPAIGVFGNRDGFIVRAGKSNPAGAVVRTIDPIVPETNDTWEVGYKGVIAGRLYVDVTGYQTKFDNFMSPLIVFANPYGGANAITAYNAKTGEELVGPSGAQIPLTYINVGKAKLTGADVGVRWLISESVALNGTSSLQKLPTITRKATDPAEATAFNSPTTKFTLGMDFARLRSDRVSGGFVTRYVNGYDFLSGVNNGHIPTFGALDVSFGYRLPAQFNAKLNVSVQNLFSCTSGETKPNGWIATGRRSIYTRKQECGLGHRHAEMLNVPSLGTMVFVGLRYDR